MSRPQCSITEDGTLLLGELLRDCGVMMVSLKRSICDMCELWKGKLLMRYRSGRIFLYVFLLALKSIQLTFDDQKDQKERRTEEELSCYCRCGCPTGHRGATCKTSPEANTVCSLRRVRKLFTGVYR